MRTAFIMLLSLCLVLTAYLFIFSTSVPDHHTQYVNEIKSNYRTYALPVPQDVYFAGESAPLERLDVREGLDREILVNTYWHSQTYLFFKRANRFFPVIEPILEQNNVPDDFKYLALIESGFANVVSPAGASGFWQFMKATAERYGLTVNEEVDERYHLEKATDAACRFINHCYRKFGSWTLAAAAYNMGENGLQNQINAQKVGNYYDLFLNQETARYVYRILAVKTIFENPRSFGFYFRQQDLYPPVRTNIITVDTSISNLAEFALQQGINLKILKEYNPWLRKRTLTNRNRTVYQIQIPLQGDLLYANHFLSVEESDENIIPDAE